MGTTIIRLIILAPLFFCASCFEPFPVEKRACAKINFDDGVYYTAFIVATGATTEENIQLWRNNKTQASLVKTYDKSDSASLAIHEKRYLIITLFKGDSKMKMDSIDISK